MCVPSVHILIPPCGATLLSGHAAPEAYVCGCEPHELFVGDDGGTGFGYAPKIYPPPAQVKAADDPAVWDYAKQHDLMIVSKDSDMHQPVCVLSACLIASAKSLLLWMPKMCLMILLSRPTMKVCGRKRTPPYSSPTS